MNGWRTVLAEWPTATVEAIADKARHRLQVLRRSVFADETGATAHAIDETKRHAEPYFTELAHRWTLRQCNPAP